MTGPLSCGEKSQRSAPRLDQKIKNQCEREIWLKAFYKHT